MGGKPRTQPDEAKKDELTYEELKSIAEEMGSCLIFALKFCKIPGAGVMYFPKTGKMQAWEDRFMDVLDRIGYVIDRKSFYANKHKKKR